MHDGKSLTFGRAILRHQGEAAPMTSAFGGLDRVRRQQLLAFLKSL